MSNFRMLQVRGEPKRHDAPLWNFIRVFNAALQAGHWCTDSD
jgi:hypothetical protein